MKKIKILSAFICTIFVFSNMPAVSEDDNNNVETFVKTAECNE